MSRITKKRIVGETEIRASACALGQVSVVDISDETAQSPPSDVHETAEEVVIRMELPGVSRENVEVRVRGSRIEVCGEKPPDNAGEDASYLCLERIFGRFHRAFDVAGSVNLNRMTAVLKEGVLVLSLPKVPDRRGRELRIPIASEEEK
ncbi:MAG: Hsp20/alpha crystallin family protein [Deltaproteobacteria bacterium]|nr:Hsp20/alpha crystallin family protein [Deltaproteobacteria bacterium]